jgi:hypothetical protein
MTIKQIMKCLSLGQRSERSPATVGREHSGGWRCSEVPPLSAKLAADRRGNTDGGLDPVLSRRVGAPARFDE